MKVWRRPGGGSIVLPGRWVPVHGHLPAEVCRLRAAIDSISEQFNWIACLSVVQNLLLGCLGCAWSMASCDYPSVSLLPVPLLLAGQYTGYDLPRGIATASNRPRQ